MSKLVLFNKPFQVLSQFSLSEDKKTLADFIKVPEVYPAGRLDFDSEGLLLLTDDGRLQNQIANPTHKLVKTYWAQLEGAVSPEAIAMLSSGVNLKDGPTRPAEAKVITEPVGWQRTPPIRYRKNDVTSWIELKITEGRNRQVRRMTAAVGYPTLRLIRWSIGDWTVAKLAPGHHLIIEMAATSSQVAGKERTKTTLNKPQRLNENQRRQKTRNRTK